MNSRVIVVVLAGLLLCGCTAADWNHATSYVGLDQDDQAAPPRAAPAETQAATTSPSAAQASASDDFCQRMAKGESNDAASEGFDAATQRRRAESSYRQCIGYSGSTTR
jgi:ABC-type uncharacterized transport system auxiliary subunit